MINRWLTALLVVLSVALIAAVVVWVTQDDGVSVTVGEPQVVSASELSEFAADADRPVYWLGERSGTSYELTETASGRVYVRYLEGDAEAGDSRADFVTVGTYQEKDGVAALHLAVAKRDGAKLGKTDNGAVLLIDPTAPKNAHLAFPGADAQVEVFSPNPGEALRLAARGAVQPVG